MSALSHSDLPDKSQNHLANCNAPLIHRLDSFMPKAIMVICPTISLDDQCQSNTTQLLINIDCVVDHKVRALSLPAGYVGLALTVRP